MPSVLTATPALRFITRFGVPKLSKWTGRHPSRVRSWTWPRSRGGTGGLIPHQVRDRIIAGALADDGQHLEHTAFEPTTGETYLPDEVGAPLAYLAEQV